METVEIIAYTLRTLLFLLVIAYITYRVVCLSKPRDSVHSLSAFSPDSWHPGKSIDDQEAIAMLTSGLEEDLPLQDIPSFIATKDHDFYQPARPSSELFPQPVYPPIAYIAPYSFPEDHYVRNNPPSRYPVTRPRTE
ncbi:hypothetical protein Hypma_008181 [Hypsizygus marmoreus]|uniref:Uncharacterized protein n=1 Tax=Hypsizygus marmoreus TaxID=39966 RepID=A0A369JVQ9_HYPMA|nr:hypothetical protein Hypma_008181 [Hypsizygus marmoreus]